MNWEIFFDNLVTSDSWRRWFAKVAVDNFWLALVPVVLLGAGLVYWKRSRLAERKLLRLYVQGVLVAVLSLLLVGWLSYYLHDPKTLLSRIDPEIVSFWQLSPTSITEVLEYLRFVGILKTALVVIVVIWVFVAGGGIFLRTKDDENGRTSPTNSEPPETGGSDTLLVTSPEGYSSGSEVKGDAYRLLFLGSPDDASIVEARLDDGTSLKASESIPFTPKTLYFREIKEHGCVNVYTEKPSAYDCALTRLSSDEFERKLAGPGSDQPDHSHATKVSLGSSFLIKKSKFKLAPVSTSATMLVGILILLVSVMVLQTSAAAEHLPNGNNNECFAMLDDEPPVLSLIYVKGDEKGDLWQINRKLTITAPGLVNMQEDINMHKFVVTEGNTSISWSLTKWQSRMTPLHIKVLFDLDKDSIYDSYPILEGTGVIIKEKRFWDAMIDTLLTSFDFDDAGNGDVVSVFSTARCDKTDAGKPIYFEKNRLAAESLTRNGIENRLRKVIFSCTYRSAQTSSDNDVSKSILEYNLPDEVESSGIRTDDTVMLIMRWKKTSVSEFDDIEYEALDTDMPRNKVLLVEMSRNPDTLSTDSANENSVVRIIAPPHMDDFGKNSQLELAEKLENMARINTSSIEFSATTSDLADLETIKDMKLMVIEKQSDCKSPAMSLLVEKKGEGIRRTVQLPFFSFLTVIAGVWMAMIVFYHLKSAFPRRRS